MRMNLRRKSVLAAVALTVLAARLHPLRAKIATT